MRKLLILALILAALGGSLPAQTPSGAYSSPASSSGGISSPSSLTTFFPKFMGPSPNDFGAFGDLKFCYDINVAGQPTASITSGSTFTLSNSALTSNVATYTFTNSSTGTVPVIAPGQTLSVTGSNNANGVLNIANAPVLSATSTTVTVAFTNANVASAADTGSITTLGAGNVGCMNFNQARDASGTPKVIEIKGVGAAGAILSTTILSVQSPTQATLAANATTNATLKKAWMGHNDNTAVQSWALAITNGFPVDSPLTGGTWLNHGGYLSGLYLVTQPIRFPNPLGNNGFCGNCGFGTPEPFSGNNAGESLSIWGVGPYRNGFICMTTCNFSLPNASVTNGLLYYQNWNGPVLWNFTVSSPDNSVAFNTTANTATVCGFVSDGNAHEWQSGLQVENWHNTTANLPGHCIVNGTYGTKIENSQMYNNDFNGFYQAPTLASGLLMSDLHFDNVQWLGTANTASYAGTSAGNVMFDAVASAAQFKGLSINNSAISDCDAGSGTNSSQIIFRNPLIVSDEVQITNTRICSVASANGFGVTMNTTPTVNLSLTNVDIRDTTANAAFVPIFIGGGTNRVKVFGGNMQGNGALTNYCNLPAGSTIAFFGTTNGTGSTTCSGANYPAGAWEGFLTAGKVAGQGNITASTFGSFSNCASSASPAVCGASSSGMFVLPAAATSVTVNTTAVTANSEIIVFNDDSLGTRLGVTCNTGLDNVLVSARVAGTSFTITGSAPVTNPNCYSYTIIN